MPKHNVALDDAAYAVVVKRKAAQRAAGKKATYSTVVLEAFQ